MGVEICIQSLSGGSIMSVLKDAFVYKILIIIYPYVLPLVNKFNPNKSNDSKEEQ